MFIFQLRPQQLFRMEFFQPPGHPVTQSCSRKRQNNHSGIAQSV